MKSADQAQASMQHTVFCEDIGKRDKVYHFPIVIDCHAQIRSIIEQKYSSAPQIIKDLFIYILTDGLNRLQTYVNSIASVVYNGVTISASDSHFVACTSPNLIKYLERIETGFENIKCKTFNDLNYDICQKIFYEEKMSGYRGVAEGVRLYYNTLSKEMQQPFLTAIKEYCFSSTDPQVINWLTKVWQSKSASYELVSLLNKVKQEITAAVTAESNSMNPKVETTPVKQQSETKTIQPSNQAANTITTNQTQPDIKADTDTAKEMIYPGTAETDSINAGADGLKAGVTDPASGKNIEGAISQAENKTGTTDQKESKMKAINQEEGSIGTNAAVTENKIIADFSFGVTDGVNTMGTDTAGINSTGTNPTVQNEAKDIASDAEPVSNEISHAISNEISAEAKSIITKFINEASVTVKEKAVQQLTEDASQKDIQKDIITEPRDEEAKIKKNISGSVSKILTDVSKAGDISIIIKSQNVASQNIVSQKVKKDLSEEFEEVNDEEDFDIMEKETDNSSQIQSKVNAASSRITSSTTTSSTNNLSAVKLANFSLLVEKKEEQSMPNSSWIVTKNHTETDVVILGNEVKADSDFLEF